MRVALVQIAAAADSARQQEMVAEWVTRIDEAGARPDLIVLPEGSMHDFGGPDHDLREAAEPLDGPFVAALAGHAKRLGATIVGQLFERRTDGGLPYNTLVAVGSDGAVLGAYRKIHLYDSFGYAESQRLSPGELEGVVVEVGAHRVGLMTCYDLRFPELARMLVDAGADTIAVPSAWVRGALKEDHWMTLLRARAIENTVYVLGAAQGGRQYCGRSSIIDPLGVVVASAGDDDTLVVGEVTAERLTVARERNPSLANRRLPGTGAGSTAAASTVG